MVNPAVLLSVPVVVVVTVGAPLVVNGTVEVSGAATEVWVTGSLVVSAVANGLIGAGAAKAASVAVGVGSRLARVAVGTGVAVTATAGASTLAGVAMVAVGGGIAVGVGSS